MTHVGTVWHTLGMANTDTVSKLYIFTRPQPHNNVVHGADGQFLATSPCGIESAEMVCLFTPAQAVFCEATPNAVAKDLNGTVCPVCFS